MLDALLSMLSMLKEGSGTSDALSTAMADAPAGAHEQNLPELGYSLAHRSTRANQLLSVSPDASLVRGTFCMAMLPKIGGIDEAV